MINQFYCHADLDDPEKLRPALQKLGGDDRITIRELDYDRMEDKLPDGIVVEWTRRDGRFGLDLEVFGEDIFPHQTEARWARTLAKELGRALLLSDCSAFPFSYYMANPDGAIWYVVVKIGDDDIMDLLSDDPINPDHFIPELIFAAGEELPERAPERPLHWTHGETSCDKTVPGKPCLTFNMPCPKQRRNAALQ